MAKLINYYELKDAVESDISNSELMKVILEHVRQAWQEGLEQGRIHPTR